MERSSGDWWSCLTIWLTLWLTVVQPVVVNADDVINPPYRTALSSLADPLTCSDAGFRGAYVNECGYCVQGTTGLERDYGRDCAGTCGKAYVDCAGKCNGQSYIDECDGKCKDISSKLLVPRSALGPSPIDSLEARDCRGLCPLRRNSELIDYNNTLLFANDGCAICGPVETMARTFFFLSRPQTIKINKNKPTIEQLDSDISASDEEDRRDTIVNDVLPLSNYRDCSGICYTPATTHLMAVNNSDTCDQCWGPKSSSLGLLELKDECGRCRKDHIPCMCSLAQQDLCGVCNGSNDSCVTIVSAFPLVIPSDTTVNVKVLGVALKNRHSTICMLIRKDIGADGKDEDRFPAVVNDVDITCDVKLLPGTYEIRLAVINAADQKVLEMSNTSFPFIVYPRTAMFNSITSPTVSLHSNIKNFTVTLHGQDLSRLTTVFCTINGTGFDSPVKVESSHVNNSVANCTFPMPSKSFLGNVTVSLDGNTAFAGPFPLRFVTPAPHVTDAFIFPEGDSLAIFFNRNIDSSISNLKYCDGYLTSSTIQRLGPNTTCSWVTKRQLLINLGPLATGIDVLPDNSTIGDRETAIVVVFKDDLLKVDNESYTETATGIELSFFMTDETPIAVLVGPQVIPPCGKFTLDGHQSIRIQNRRVTYVWAVSTADLNSTGQALLNAIEENNRKNLPWLTLDADHLETEVHYKFSLTIFNSRKENASSNSTSNVASLIVTKSSQLVPAVVIEPNLADYPNAVTVDQGFVLHSYVTTPKCQHEIYSIKYNWTVSNPRVKFDLRQLNEDSYKIAPYTLPVGENVTFTLRVTLNNNRNISSESSVNFIAAPAAVKAYVEGGFRRSVGNESGILVLNSSKSYYPDKPSLPLLYRWECLEIDGNKPCYDYDVNSGQILLLTQPVTRLPVLSIPTNKLRPGKVVQLTLTAISPLDPTVYSEPKTTTILVVNGSAPIVSIVSLVPMNELVTKPEMADMVHLIPSMTDILVTATVSFSTPIDKLEWVVEGLNVNFSAHTTNSSLKDGSLESTVVIPRDYLIAKGLYEVGLKVKDLSGREGFAYEAFTVLPSVTGCNITIPDYEAFQMVTVTIKNCVAEDGSYPLSYQVYVYKGSHLISLSPPEYHLPMDIMGPPDMTNTNTTLGHNVFSIQVCDALSNCHWFNSSRIVVRAASDLQATAEHAFFMANIAKLKGDYLACLRRHVLYLMAVTPPYRARHEMEYGSQMAEAFLCAKMAAEVQCQEHDCFDDLFTFLTSIIIENGPGRDFILMEVIERAIYRLDMEGLGLSTVGAQEAIYVLEKIYKFNTSNTDIAKRVVDAKNTLQKVLARSLRMGETSLLMDSEGHLMAALTYTLLNGTFEVNLLPKASPSEATANLSLKLSFDNQMKEKFSNWECDVNSSKCHGMVAEMLFFPDRDMEPVEVDHNKTVSEVVLVALLNPITGNEIDDSTYLTLTLMANESQMDENLEYNCYSWNPEDKSWSTDGVSTGIVNKTIFNCVSDKPSYFAVIGAVRTFSAGEIAGIVLGVLGAVALIAAVGFFFYKKARTKTMRVSISKA